MIRINVFLLLNLIASALPVGGRRLNSVESSKTECTIAEFTSKSVGDFCSEVDEITEFKNQIPDIRSSLAEISAALDELLRDLTTTTGGAFTCGTTMEECEAAYLSAATPAVTVMTPTETLDSCEDADGWWVAGAVDGLAGYDADTMRVCQMDGEFAVEMDGVVYPTCVAYGTPATDCTNSDLICPDRNASPNVFGYSGNVRSALASAFTRADFGHPMCPTSTCMTMDDLAQSGTYWRDSLANNPYTDLTDAQIDALCVTEDMEVMVVTAAGKYSTCVGWSSSATDMCDSGMFLCAGHSGEGKFTYGWPGQIARTVAVAAANVDGNYLHPQCPLMICAA